MKHVLIHNNRHICGNILHIIVILYMYPPQFSDIFPNGWEFLTNFLCFTHLLYVPLYARLQIFMQLSPILTKLCHIKCDHEPHFYISLELKLLSLLTEQMTSLLTSCDIRHVC